MIANGFLGLKPILKDNYSKGSKMKPKLGSGERFKKLKETLAKRGDVRDPGALAASIGRKKYGQAKMTKMSQAGKK